MAGIDHLRRYRTVGLIVGAVALAAFFFLVRAEVAAGRAAKTVTVCSTGADFDSIQKAVGAAKSGDRIEVCAETFPEQVVITDKKLTLVGEGPSKTTIKAPDQLTGLQNIVEIGKDADVDLSGFTIAGPGPANDCSGLLAGVFVRDGGNAKIHGNVVSDMRNAPFDGCQKGFGILVGRGPLSTTGTAEVRDNTISDYQKGGIYVDGEGSRATVVGNTVTGHGQTDLIAQNAIGVVRDAGATVEDNKVNASGPYTGPDDTESTGILLFGTLGDTTVARNGLSDDEFGIEAAAEPAQGKTVEVKNNTVTGGDRGIALYASKDLRIEDNTIKGASTFGVYANDDTSGNFFHANDANAGDKALDCRDASTGTRSAGTANTWHVNTGVASSPKAICTAKITVDTPPIIVLPPPGQQPPSSGQPPGGGQPQPPPSPPASPPPAGTPQPPAGREAITLANEILARMKGRMLKSCAITLYARGSQNVVLARGVAKAPPKGKGQLVVQVALLPKGEKVLSNLVGGAIVDVRAVCRTTSNKTGQKTVTARAVLQIEHTTTPPGSWVPDKAVLTPAGERFLKTLARRMVTATRIRCDGHTASYPASPVNATALSIARARLVCNRLKRKNVAVELRLVPHASRLPVATNGTEAGRSINRRVGVTIVHPVAVRSTGAKR